MLGKLPSSAVIATSQAIEFLEKFCILTPKRLAQLRCGTSRIDLVVVTAVVPCFSSWTRTRTGC